MVINGMKFVAVMLINMPLDNGDIKNHGCYNYD